MHRIARDILEAAARTMVKPRDRTVENVRAEAFTTWVNLRDHRLFDDAERIIETATEPAGIDRLVRMADVVDRHLMKMLMIWELPDCTEDPRMEVAEWTAYGIAVIAQVRMSHRGTRLGGWEFDNTPDEQIQEILDSCFDRQLSLF